MNIDFLSKYIAYPSPASINSDDGRRGDGRGICFPKVESGQGVSFDYEFVGPHLVWFSGREEILG